MLETDIGIEVSRCSLCDYNLNVVFDSLVKPKGKIKDYKTMYSGIDKSSYEKYSSIT